MSRITRRSLFGRIIRIPAAIALGITATTVIPTTKITKDPPFSTLPGMWSIDPNHPLAFKLVGYSVPPDHNWVWIEPLPGRKVHV